MKKLIVVGCQFVVLRTKLDKIDGRKVWVKGSMETLDGQIVAESKSVVSAQYEMMADSSS